MSIVTLNGHLNALRVLRLYAMVAAALMTCFLPLPSFAEETYVVSYGDTLSTIAHKYLPGRVYGNGGSLQRLFISNPSLANHPNEIRPGDELRLIDRAPAAASEQPEQKPEAQVILSSPDVQVLNTSSTRTESKERSVLHLAPRFVFNSIDATDLSSGTHAKLASELGLGAELNWDLIFNPSSKVSLGLSFDRFNERTLGRAIENPDVSKSQLAIAFSQTFNESTTLQLRAAAERISIVQPLNPTTIAFASVWIPELGLDLEKILYKSELFKMSAEIEGAYHFPSHSLNADVQAGRSFGAALKLSQEQGPLPLAARAFYRQSRQQSAQIDQIENVIGLTFGVDFDITPTRGRK